MIYQNIVFTSVSIKTRNTLFISILFSYKYCQIVIFCEGRFVSSLITIKKKKDGGRMKNDKNLLKKKCKAIYISYGAPGLINIFWCKFCDNIVLLFCFLCDWIFDLPNLSFLYKNGSVSSSCNIYVASVLYFS